MTENIITVQATVATGIKKVWDYYTQPEHITKWNFATNDWACPTARNDLKPGGRYSARMEAKDGSFGFDFEAVYEEVIEPVKFVYTMTDGRQATVTFEQIDDKTVVTITFDAETQNPVDLQRNGWQAILTNFKIYTENN